MSGPDATVEGVLQAPCDPLLLAIDVDAPLRGLTEEIDWRLAGRLSRLVATDWSGECVLLPESPILPTGRLVLAPFGISVHDLAAAVSGLRGSRVGLCLADFGYSEPAARSVFGDRAVFFRGQAR